MVASFRLTPDIQDMAGWQYLVNWILTVILGLAFVFYFARLVGWIISLFLEVFLWKRHRVRVTIGAFRVSPLGGRIMARNVVISTADYTVSILRLNLTWRYWLLRMTRLPAFHFAPERGEHVSGLTADSNAKLPTSLLLHIDGLEVFMYNRTAAYENIEETLRKCGSNTEKTPEKEAHVRTTRVHSTNSASNSTTDSSTSKMSAESAPENDSSGLNFLLQMLPLQTTIKRGAFVLGNHTTPSILVASFRTAKALLDVSAPASNFDLYRTEIDLNMDRFQVQMKPNITYDPQRYSRSEQRSFKGKVAAAVKKTFHKHSVQDMLSHLRLKRRKRRANSQQDDWHGLRRYVGEFPQERVVELTDIEEYAKYSLILDSVSTQIKYFYDVPGVQPSRSAYDDQSPQTGVDVELSMATVHYGSWADRQRAPLQTLLFPALARDGEPSGPQNEPGTLRKYACFTFNVCTPNELIVRVPTREFSKDKEELATREEKQKNTRPFGWLELKLGKGTEFTYTNAYVASQDGWPNTLHVDMADLEVRTSVTHDILFTADRHVLDAEIGFPLQWNGECFWKFAMDSTQGKFFFLREHITLFIDMVSDFASGAPAKFENYRPFTYALSWSVHDFSLYFNVNDHNIINDPLDFDSNKYICFRGDVMDIDLTLPLKGMFAASSNIEYRVFAPSLDLTLEVPPWHTVSAFMKGSKKMGSTANFQISGNYTYYSKVEVDHNNFAVIDVTGDDITLLFHGYLVRYLFTFQENYFGDFINFRTFEEYILSEGVDKQDSMTNNSESPSQTHEPDYWKLLKAENDLNIVFTFKAREGIIVLPGQIYDHAHHISLCFDYLDVDIHLCQFYMDLQADFSTASGYQITPEALASSEMIFYRKEYGDLLSLKSPDIIIDTFSVHTHRMLGVDDLTYQCKWDFACDLISIDGNPSILSGLDTVFENFVLGYRDLENSLTYQVPATYDAAHFSFRCPEIKIRLNLAAPQTFLEIEIDDLLATFNDVANERYSSRMSVLLPRVVARVIDESGKPKILAFLETSLHQTNFTQKLNMQEHRDLQHEHIRRNDATTHRTSFLLYADEKDEAFFDAKDSVFATVSLPMASVPLTEEFLSYHKPNDSRSSLGSDSIKSDSDESSIVNGEMCPTTIYPEEDFKPVQKPDNQFKNDSFVLKFETVKLCLCPQGLNIISRLVLGAEESDIDILLDKLQCSVMKDLKTLILPVPMIDNVRFVSPLIDVRVAEHIMDSPASMFSSSQPFPVLTLAILEPSLALSMQHSRVRLGSYLEEQTALTLALHVSEAYVSVSLPTCFSAAASIQVSEVEAWCTKTEGITSVASLSMDFTKAVIDQYLLPGVICFVQHLLATTEESFSNFAKAASNSKRWKGDLLYALCKYGVTHRVSSDPEVITKPARILRSKRDHVRFYEAWKIMTKLRSIAGEMTPGEARLYCPENESQRAPADAVAYVTDSFKAWRPWEGNMKQRENFFRKMLSGPEAEDTALKVMLDIASFEINLTGQEVVSDYIMVSKVKVQAAKSQNLRDEDAEDDNMASAKVDLAVQIDVVDSALTTSIISIFDTLKKSSSSPKPEVAESAVSKNTPTTAWTVSFLFSLSSFRCRLNLVKTHIELTLAHFTSSVVGRNGPGTLMSFGWASQLGEIAVSLGKHEVKYLALVSKDSTVVASGSIADSMTMIVQSDMKHLDMRILDDENTLGTTITEFLDEDVRLVLDKMGSSTGEGHVTPAKAESGHANLPSLSLTFGVETFSILIDAFQPLTFHGVLTGASTKLSISKHEVYAEYAHKNFAPEIEIYETSILRARSSDLSVSAVLTDLEECWLVKADIDSTYFKVVTPSLMRALDAVLKHYSSIIDKIDHLKSSVLESKLVKSKGESKEVISSSLSDVSVTNHKRFFFKVDCTQKYCGWLAYKDQTRFTIELEESSLKVGNIVDPRRVVSLVSGELVVPTTRISIYDPQFSVGLSTLLDYHLSVKVLNDAFTEGDDHGGQSLQVESEYFRVCVSPPVLFKILELSDAIKRKFDQYEGVFTSKPHEAVSAPAAEELPLEKVTSRKPLFSSVHVLSYNFCLGWVFGGSHKDYPGMILGAERIFAVTKADLGKLTLVGGYLSVAHGSTTSSFYSSASEFDNLNRAFMPKVQLNYYVDPKQKLWITLKGDELDVRCMSNSTVLIERGMKSGTQVRGFFESRSKMAELKRQNTKSFPVAETAKAETPRKTFNPHFSAVQCIVGFAGARVFIYKLQEENLQDEPNSLNLQSPAISIVVDYAHQKKAAKKHVVKAEVLMSQSDNTIYASCVPVVEDFVRTFKDMFKNTEEKSVASARPEKEPKPSNLGAEFGSLFEQADMHIGVRIEKQRISLSCEPTAKVAAIVEYDGGSISACSGMETYDSIYVLGQINSISASLQHIYSDERSGSLVIKNIVLSSMIAFKDDLEIVSTCCISDISGYVKMKQYQDVDLFTDIWFPKTYDASPAEMEQSAVIDYSQSQSQSCRSAQNQSESGISVVLDFILSNITLEVDFGPALGVMVLDIDKAWAVSRKISSWSYELQVGLQTLVVGSEGRLGGYLKIGGLFLNSGIEWKLGDMPLLEVPLVHMAAGFGHMQLKTIFDEHVFAFVNLKDWRFDVFNRKNGANFSKDHLFVSIRYNVAEAFLTSLAVSDFYDIYETVSRMIEEKRTSYKEILKDSNKESFMNRACSSDFLDVAKKLDTQIEVFTGLTTIQVYPHSFHDSKVFVIQLDRSTANFTQNEYEFGVSNQIELQLNNVKASFSSTAGTTKETVHGFDVDELSKYASKAKGGLILGFPRFMISMRTYQKFHTNVVEYLFQSSFGGTVDIRWNLGSVNCVREMYAAHKRALLSRTEVSKDRALEFSEDADLNDIISQDSGRLKREAEEDASRMLASSDTPHKDFDKDIQQTMEKVTSKSKFTYKALAPAIIEAPQLKELGSATPPLEWFGLHRNKFPDATHQLAIVTLQKLIHEIELEYSKTLGKA
ncbi:hypothetical protein OY671_004671 [Metschnikowia pulcherrima]|nr:hypothetical protein OY671_004671 [Metschnikowia pulcherrima]